MSPHPYVDELKFKKGYKFDKTENVFKDYVLEFYRKKSTSKDSVMRAISKSLLNNLLGRFGMVLDKTVVELMSHDRLKEIQQCKKIINLKYIADKILV